MNLGYMQFYVRVEFFDGQYTVCSYEADFRKFPKCGDEFFDEIKSLMRDGAEENFNKRAISCEFTTKEEYEKFVSETVSQLQITFEEDEDGNTKLKEEWR